MENGGLFFFFFFLVGQGLMEILKLNVSTVQQLKIIVSESLSVESLSVNHCQLNQIIVKDIYEWNI